MIDIASDDDEEDSVEVLEVEKETHPISDAKSVELSDVESTKEKEVLTVEGEKPDDDDIEIFRTYRDWGRNSIFWYKRV